MSYKKINIGIVGLNFGRWIIRELQQGEGRKYFLLGGVCDKEADKTGKTAGSTGVKPYYSLKELLNDEDIEAVGLFTGPHGRAGLIRQIIHAGKDVITTKPFELDPQQALDVLREAKKTGRIIHINSPAPALPFDLRMIKRWHREYNLGRPVACRMDTWASYREKPDGSWYDDSEKCPVAPVLRIGIYLINELVSIFGEADKVQVMQSRIFTGRPTADNAQISILFKNGALANVFASFCIKDGQPYRNSMVLNYENGTIYRNFGKVESGKLHNEKGVCLVTSDGKDGILTEWHKLNSAVGDYQWKIFYDSIRRRKIENETTPEDVVAGIKIINAMARAEKSGRTETV